MFLGRKSPDIMMTVIVNINNTREKNPKRCHAWVPCLRIVFALMSLLGRNRKSNFKIYNCGVQRRFHFYENDFHFVGCVGHWLCGAHRFGPVAFSDHGWYHPGIGCLGRMESLVQQRLASALLTSTWGRRQVEHPHNYKF